MAKFRHNPEIDFDVRIINPIRLALDKDYRQELGEAFVGAISESQGKDDLDKIVETEHAKDATPIANPIKEFAPISISDAYIQFSSHIVGISGGMKWTLGKIVAQTKVSQSYAGFSDQDAIQMISAYGMLTNDCAYALYLAATDTFKAMKTSGKDMSWVLDQMDRLTKISEKDLAVRIDGQFYEGDRIRIKDTAGDKYRYTQAGSTGTVKSIEAEVTDEEGSAIINVSFDKLTGRRFSGELPREYDVHSEDAELIGGNGRKRLTASALSRQICELLKPETGYDSCGYCNVSYETLPPPASCTHCGAPSGTK
jgi:hypothetical protein